MLTLNVNLSYKSYPIFIRKGILNELGDRVKDIYNGEKIAVVTDTNVNRLYGDIVKCGLRESGYNVKVFEVEPGESSKSIGVLEDLYDKLLDYKITRGDLIIALGGGVVGDLTGFAASTLLRGIPFVQIPTSLLAQIDSSIGGKVAVNLKRGKNLVGSFYHPEAVFIDPSVLKTLDKRFFSDGMAEVIKYGCIRDAELFKRLMEYNEEEFLNNIDEIIYTCCNIKREIVEKDERDSDLRMILNFGHTLGHAIEKYFDYSEYTHGEAVAMGMYSITLRSEALGLTQSDSAKTLKILLNKYGLKEIAPKMNIKAIIDTIALDKKNNGESINLILLRSIGEAFIKNINKKEVINYFD